MIAEPTIAQRSPSFDELEAAIASLPEAVLETVHHFSPGVYARELRIPAGVVLTGKKHRGPCLNFVVGDIGVFNNEGKEQRRITGYECFVSPAGTRRAGLAYGNTVWTTIHPTDETDLMKIENEVIEPHHNLLLAGTGRKLL